MIPILYNSNETNFSGGGVGFLSDCTRCVVTEERNGVYECEFSYPIDGRHYSEIEPDMIIKAKPNEMSDPQLFRIYRTSKPINGIVNFYCQHISYDLNVNVVDPFTLSGATALTALQGILSHCYYQHSFAAQSTLSFSETHDLKIDKPKPARMCLGGSEGSVLDLFGGEYEFDNFNVKLHAERGQDTGVTILYGKNLTDITSDVNISSAYTAVYPYAIDTDRDGLYTLTEKVIETGNTNFGEPRVLSLDLTEKFNLPDEEITETKLRNIANAYITNNHISDVKQNIEISFVQLWQTPEYKDIALLQRVGLCDTVTVIYSKLGVSVKAKVIKTVYNALTEKYEKIELGKAKSNFGMTLKESVEQIEKEVARNKSAMQKAIENATKLITGQDGGYVVMNTTADGHPYEILIMNTDDIQTATKLWRWNLGGLGYSSTGYNGQYGTAITMDGAIVADYITTGTLNAGLIKTGIIEDEQHTNYWNMNTGEFRLSASTKVGTSASNQTLSNYVNSAAAGTLTQQNVFNALTSNGALQGIFMSGGDLYINGTYINSGAINANLITTGTINADLIRAGTIASANGRTTISMSTGDISVAMNSGAKMGIGVLGMSIYDSNNNVVSRYGLNTSHYGTGNNSGKYSTFDYEYLSFDNGYSHVQIAPTSNYSGISISKLVSSDVSATNISGTTAEYKHFSVTDSNSSEIGSFQKITVTSSGVSSEKSKITSDQGEITELKATKISSVSELNGHPLQRILQTINGVNYYVWGYQAT